MRILYFSQEYSPHDWRFLDSLTHLGQDVWYLCLQPGPSPKETRPIPEGVHVIQRAPHASSPHRWFGRRRIVGELRRIISNIRPDVLHAGPIDPCGTLAVRTGFRPLVLASLGSDLLVHADRDPQVRRRSVEALSAADIVVGDCQAVREKIHALVQLPDDRIVTFPWGVDLSIFHPQARTLRKRWGWEGKIVIVSTRGWEPGYEIMVLLRAFAILHAKMPRVRLLLVGDGSLADEIREYIQDHGLDDAVVMPGRVPNPELPAYLCAGDVYVSSAPSDGSSVSLMEALACGLPAIAVDNPSNREWISPGAQGGLFEKGNAESMANALERVVRLAPAQTAVMAAGNAALARERADWAVNSRRLLEAYELATRTRQAVHAA